jgi:hypothetical protein
MATTPAGKGVANSPPLKPATVKGGAIVAMTVCIRRAGCTCADCAEMSGLSLVHVAAASLTTAAPAKTKPGAGNKSVMTTKATALSSSSCSSSDAVPVDERPDSPPDAAACPAEAQAAACPHTAGAAEEPLVAAEAAAGAAEEPLVAEDAAAASPGEQPRSNELFELAPHTGPQVKHVYTYP